MGLFARFICLRHEESAHELAQTVQDMLRARNMVEAADPADAERLLVIAPAGPGWLMVLDHAESSFAAMDDADGLLAELSCAPGRTALDITIADSDELFLSLIDGGAPRGSLAIDHDGLRDGVLEPWAGLLQPGQTVADIAAAFPAGATFIEEHLPRLKPLLGLDLASFNEVGTVLSGHAPGHEMVLLRLKTVAPPGHSAGPPRLEVEDSDRHHYSLNDLFSKIPSGFITNIAPGFNFQSRGGAARGLEVRLAGSALERGLVEVISGHLSQKHPVDRERSRHITVAPEATPAGLVLRFPDLEVPDWVLQPDLQTRRPPRGLHDLRLSVRCRGLKPGAGDVEAEAHLVSPGSEPARVAYPVTVLPEMWRPLKGDDQPLNVIPYVISLNRPTQINALAVLRGGSDEAVSALQRTLATWRSLVDPGDTFRVAFAAAPPVQEPNFHQPPDWVQISDLNLSEERQPEWDRLLADLPALQRLIICSEFGCNDDHRPADDRDWPDVKLFYLAPASRPDMPEFAARLGHVALSAGASDAARSALVKLIQALAGVGLIGQAYVADWENEYSWSPNTSTLYELATGIVAHDCAAHGWGTRYLRAVADRLWLGPAFAARIPDRAALERVAVVTVVGDTLGIERRPEASLRDIELCLEPMLATQADLAAFWDLLNPLDE
jgi:hypothetical protein